MSESLRCSYCGSADLTPYMVKYYKCGDCGRIVIKPIIIPLSTPTTETI